MKTTHYYLSRKQIVVVWEDGDTRMSANYPRSEAGQRRANAKLARLQADSYTLKDAPKDWYTELLERAIAARGETQP